MAWKFYSADGSLLTKVPSAATATEATNVTVVANNSTDETVYPTFVDGATGTQGIETDTGLTYNPNSGLLTTTTVAAALSGNATTASTATEITVSANNTTDETVYPIFVDGATGAQGAETDTGLTYNPSSGVITATQFTGAVSGNATTASTATEVTVSANNSTDETVYPVFVDGATGGQGLESDTGFTYNPSTGALTATSFTGSVTGSVTGTASEITISANNSTDETVYPVFVDGATGSQGLESDTGLTYNPSTGVLSAVALTLTGDLTVGGTTTTINSTTLTVDDKNIEMGSVGSPDDTTADGGGLTLKGASDKTIIWDNANDNWTSNQHWNIASGLSYKINNVVTLSATALGSAVVGSSLTSVGTLTSLTVSGSGASSITSTSGAVSLVSQSTSANGILLHANGGTSESIKLHSDQGTSATSINLVSDAGGITLDVPDGKLITLDGATVFDDEIAVAYNSGNPVVDCTKGNKFNVAMTGNVTTLFFTNPGSTVSGNYMVRLIHDGGARTIGNYYHTGGTTKVHFSGGTAPTLTSATDAEDILSLYWDGAAFHATIMLDSKAYS